MRIYSRKMQGLLLLLTTNLASLAFGSFNGVITRVSKDDNRVFNDDSVPPQWDWREKAVIFPVTDQGGPGDGFASVLTEAISAYHAIKTGALIRLSSQELIDCCLQTTPSAKPEASKKPTAPVAYVYKCIVDLLDGLCSAADYPPASQAQQCMSNKCTPRSTINGGYWIADHNETDLQAAVYKNPAAVMVDASQLSFQTYQSGVYDDPNCDQTMLDHALLIVGYGTMDGQDVWACKNSWGADWGDRGYIYIARNKNVCGIASQASIPV